MKPKQYRICASCKAALDPEERCDCGRHKSAPPAATGGTEGTKNNHPQDTTSEGNLSTALTRLKRNEELAQSLSLLSSRYGLSPIKMIEIILECMEEGLEFPEIAQKISLASDIQSNRRRNSND